jgi:DNA topoisomerase-3
MLHLVRHFGDISDSLDSCEICDVCSPGDCVALELREPSLAERSAMERILKSLRDTNGQTSGQLHRELFADAMERNTFERLLGALVRAGLAKEEEDSFERDGRVIEFRRAFLTRAGRSADGEAIEQALVVPEARSVRKPRAKSRNRATATGSRKGKSSGRETSPSKPAVDLDASTAPPRLVKALQDWRLAEARRRRTPAFRILSNRALLGIATAIPRDEEALLAVNGMGPTLVQKFGAQILEVIRRNE